MSSDYVNIVAGRIVQQLKEGTAPWVMPWKSGEHFMPHNPITGKNYHGMNSLWLMAQGYQDLRWMTYKQASEVGGQVKKGEKGTVIQYWQWQEERIKKDEQGKPFLDKNREPVKETVRLERPRVFSAVVFNADQINGLANDPGRELLTEWERHEQAERVLLAGNPKIRYEDNNNCYYSFANDHIVLVPPQRFESTDSFYATALHEKAHWTGHDSRLNRDLRNPFGSEGYAREELRAEIASLMLGEQLSIGHDPGQHVAYIDSWVRVLEQDPREIFRAASDAEKIVKYLQDLVLVKEQEAELVPTVSFSKTAPSPVSLSSEHPAMSLPGELDRVYLAVPYSEKDEAKARGAKWDKNSKAWYVPAGIDRALFEAWLPTPENTRIEPVIDPRQEFFEALCAADLVLNGLPEMDGKLHRVPVMGEAASGRSGAYTGFLDGHPAGYIQNFSTGYVERWKASSPSSVLSETDKARLRAEAAQNRQTREIEQEKSYGKAAEIASDLYQQAKTSGSWPHPYLMRKNVNAYGIRYNGDDLMIPIYSLGEEKHLMSLQTISEEGRKSFLKGGKVQGGAFLIGANPRSVDTPILIAEGYATGATLHEATGYSVFVAFSGSNLKPVAEKLQSCFPDRRIFIAGDNDHAKEQTGQPNNGRKKAQEAAEAIHSVALLPSFKNTEKGSDWNDAANIRGLDQITCEIEQAINRALGKEKIQVPMPSKIPLPLAEKTLEKPSTYNRIKTALSR